MGVSFNLSEQHFIRQLHLSFNLIHKREEGINTYIVLSYRTIVHSFFNVSNQDCIAPRDL